MHGAGHHCRRQARSHELQQRHLRCCVLHGYSVGVEVGVACAALHLLRLGVEQVVDEDLLSEREWAAKAAAPKLCTMGEFGVDALHQFDRSSCGDGHVIAPCACQRM